MARYHLYYIRGGMLVGSDDVDAPDDGEAVRLAREQGQGELVEIWNEHQRVRIVPCAAVEA